MLLLTEKSYLHTLVGRINDEGAAGRRPVRRHGCRHPAVCQKAIYGPLGGFRPRLLWTLVLLFSGLTFLGYLARRVTHGMSGYRVAGLLGASSRRRRSRQLRARLSRTDPSSSRALALGTVAATLMLFRASSSRCCLLNPRVAAQLVLYLRCRLRPARAILLLVRMPVESTATVQSPENPLQFIPALQMAIGFQCVLFATTWVRSAFGTVGLVASGAFLGLTDVDALTVSMAGRRNKMGTSAATAAPRSHSASRRTPG